MVNDYGHNRNQLYNKNYPSDILYLHGLLLHGIALHGGARRGSCILYHILEAFNNTFGKYIGR